MTGVTWEPANQLLGFMEDRCDMRRRSRLITSLFWRIVLPVALAVTGGIIVAVVNKYAINRPPAPAPPLDSVFTLGMLMGQAPASIIARFPDEDISPSEDYLQALRQNLSLIGYNARAEACDTYRRALQQANQTREPQALATILATFGECKAAIQAFVEHEQGRCAGYVLQLGIDLPYIRRSLITLHDLEVFYRRGEVEAAEYRDLLTKAISTVDPMIEFFREAAASDCFDANRSIREAIAFVATTSLFGVENRGQAWDALKDIAQEYHVPLTDYVMRPSPEPSGHRVQPSETKDAFYKTLLDEARSLSGTMRPRSHTMDEVTDNIRKREELARRAQDAVKDGRLTKTQCDSILTALRQLKRR